MFLTYVKTDHIATATATWSGNLDSKYPYEVTASLNGKVATGRYLDISGDAASYYHINDIATGDLLSLLREACTDNRVAPGGLLAGSVLISAIGAACRCERLDRGFQTSHDMAVLRSREYQRAQGWPAQI